MGGKADATLQRGQAQLRAQARREPRVRHWQSGPGTFVQPAEDEQIGVLQPRLQQTPDEQARVLAVRRPRRLTGEQALEQDRQLAGIDPRWPLPRRLLMIRQQSCRRPALRPRPDHIARQGGHSAPKRAEQAGEILGFSDGLFQRPQQRHNACPPGRRLVAQGSLALVTIGEMRPDPVQPRRGARPAQHPVEQADAVQPSQPLWPGHHQRMFEQGQQRHGREPLRRSAGGGEQQGAGRGLGERAAGRVVRLDSPAAEMGGNAAGEVAVGRHQGRGPARFLQRLAQRQRDRLRLLCRVGQLQRADAGQPALSWFQLLPFTGEGRRRHRMGDGPAAGRGRVPASAPAPWLYLPARDAHPVKQQLQVELRVRLHRPLPEARGLVGPVRAEFGPLLIRHREIQAG